MLKVSLFVCLVTLCYAQPMPTPPDLPETFTSKYDVLQRGRGEEERGEGTWDRSVEKETYMRRNMFKTTGPVPKESEEETLANFMAHMHYNLMTNAEGKLECREDKIPEDAKFPVYWEWLKTAHYREFKDPRTNKTFDAWEERRDEGVRRLLIDRSEPTKPAAMMESRNGFEEDMRFNTFESMEPPASAFEVPEACKTPPMRHN